MVQQIHSIEIELNPFTIDENVCMHFYFSRRQASRLISVVISWTITIRCQSTSVHVHFTENISTNRLAHRQNSSLAHISMCARAYTKTTENKQQQYHQHTAQSSVHITVWPPPTKFHNRLIIIMQVVVVLHYTYICITHGMVLHTRSQRVYCICVCMNIAVDWGLAPDPDWCYMNVL